MGENHPDNKWSTSNEDVTTDKRKVCSNWEQSKNLYLKSLNLRLVHQTTKKKKKEAAE